LFLIGKIFDLMKLLPFIFILLSFGVHAQLRISTSIGYGTYFMNDMRDWQKEVKKGLPVDAEEVSTFPGYLNFESSVTYDSKRKFFIGAIIGFGSTGGRLSYSDYSGSLTLDQLLKYYSLNISIGSKKEIISKKYLFSFDFRPGIILTELVSETKTKLGVESLNQSYEFKSINWSVQPTVCLTRRINSFGLHAFVGYNLSVKRGKLKLKENKNFYLLNSDGSDAHAQWGGVRLGLGLTYFFKAKRVN